ncbi:hypothetical protein, partial [Escherichia coli]|uniref:hypothetical protein n=1 Tax=Escherichia coli TaxID=562 RepID=UPI00383E92DE
TPICSRQAAVVQIYVFIDFNCLFCLLLFALSVLFFKQHKVSNLFFFPFGIIVFFDVFVGFAL